LDWEDDWVFDYEAFDLEHCEDQIFLSFIVKTFNLYVRNESSPWLSLLDKINSLIKEDGYKLYVSKRSSGNDVYGFKEIFKRKITLEKE
jgi:hypothetical protein